MAKVGIVGGGIIGSAIATWLIADGHQVTLYERDPGGKPASGGNAGLIAVPQIYPVARPGMLVQVPGWLTDLLGPLTVLWRDLPSMAPWLVAFLKAATPRGEARTMDALAGLARTVLSDHFELGRRARLTGHLRNTGALSVHDRGASLDAAAALYGEVKRRIDVDFERLTANAARALVPELEGAFAGALHFKDFWIVTHPMPVLRHYQGFVRAEARLIGSAVKAVRQGASGVTLEAEDGSASTYEFVVTAAGIWSRELVRQLGLKVLLEAERGYNTTYDNPKMQLKMPVIFGDHGFVATPFVDALRVGGAVELASPEAPPNFARAKAMRAKMRRYVPALPEEGGIEWMGRRPATPDSMPVISRHPRDRRILFAFGHGHMGLTYSAATARLVAAMVAGKEDAKLLAPFDIARFQ
ncbi:MAG: FAD-binding oxidoreductase [Cucumibacter sp.]